MFEGGLIESELASRCGYLRVGSPRTERFNIHRPSVYRASWSSNEVEHFIYLGSDIKYHTFFAGRFGIRSQLAEKFSIDSLIAHGHPNFRLFIDHYNDKTGCMLTYDFQRFNWAMKKVEPSVFLPDAKPAYIASFISAFVSDRLLPVVGHVTNSEAFFRFLIEDAEPCRWFATHPAVRAAQIVALGSNFGMEKDQIRRSLELYERLIAKNLYIPRSDDAKSCVDWYVDQLAADWAKRRN
jgi:hypothetical protein